MITSRSIDEINELLLEELPNVKISHPSDKNSSHFLAQDFDAIRDFDAMSAEEMRVCVPQAFTSLSVPS